MRTVKPEKVQHLIGHPMTTAFQPLKHPVKVWLAPAMHLCYFHPQVNEATKLLRTNWFRKLNFKIIFFFFFALHPNFLYYSSNKYLRVDFGLSVYVECLSVLRNHLQQPNQIDRAKPLCIPIPQMNGPLHDEFGLKGSKFVQKGSIYLFTLMYQTKASNTYLRKDT